MRKISLFIAFWFSLIAFGQDADIIFNADSSKITLKTDLDIVKLLEEDEAADKQGLPERIAVLFPFEINSQSAGKWSELPDGLKSWQIKIEVPGSYGVMLNYDSLYIPKGASLYVYGENDSEAFKFTHEDNPLGGFFQSDIQTSNTIHIDYIAEENVTEQFRIKTHTIGFRYKDDLDAYIYEKGETKGLNETENYCISNINCLEGIPWQTQKKGVVRLTLPVNRGALTCSGTLVNNTECDKSPYILTAAHCLDYNGWPVDLSRTIIHFEDEFQNCENEKIRPQGKQMASCALMTVIPIVNGSDGALLKIDNNIPSDWDVYFNGWDRRNDGSKYTSGAVIHHPHGDVKKITLYNTPLTSTTWQDISFIGGIGAHWKVQYSDGVTQKGSSGAPIFNQDGLVVGSLTGGSSACNKPQAYDQYGKMWFHWDQYPNVNNQMHQYLDPSNKGTEILKGLDNIKKDPIENELPHVDPEVKTPVVFRVVEGTKALDIRVHNKKGKDETKIKEIEVYNISGYRILSYKIEPTWTTEIPTLGWGPGLYVIKVKFVKGDTYKYKFLK